MSEANRTSEMNRLLAEMRLQASAAPSLKVLQERIVQALAEKFRNYNWTGFYMLDPEESEMLILGPFFGDPTPHVRIPMTEGICGAAAASGKTVIVDDVNSDPRYLSCSIKTKSEIVVPIYAHGKVVGEIDIDSHSGSAFTRADGAFLESVAQIVGNYIERNACNFPLSS
ncbi:MAG: GAF domain-containing protein [Terracidiphilus sp.]|jgi:GAF domain-containing protein